MRSLVGLDRAAAVDAFGEYLDDSRFSVDQIRFVTMIVDELTANGVMEPARLFESPYTDLGHIDELFPQDYGEIVSILRSVKERAEPAEVA